MLPAELHRGECRHPGILAPVLFGMPPPFLAHRNVSLSPDRWWWNWNFDPLLLLMIGGAIALYWRGVKTMRCRIGSHAVSSWQMAAATAGTIALVLALLSPLDPLSDWLGSAHMIQHMLLIVVAAPLLAVGAPVLVFLWGIPAVWRPTCGHWLRPWLGSQPPGAWFRRPLVAWAVFAVTLWLWHVPALYQSALRDPLIHDMEHLTFFGAALLYWRVLAGPAMQRTGPAGAVLYIFTTSLHASALGALMTVSPRVWYPEYRDRTIVFGLTALEDQQLAGVIMWMPACLVYVIAAGGIVAIWLWDSEHKASPQRESIRS